MALFVLLTGATWARIVAADLLARPSLGNFRHAAASLSRNFELTLLLALKLLLQLIDRRRGLTNRHRNFVLLWLRRMRSIGGKLLPFNRARPGSFGYRLTVRSHNLHQEKIADRVFLEARHHRFKHVERFAFVGNQRILLCVAAKTDS